MTHRKELSCLRFLLQDNTSSQRAQRPFYHYGNLLLHLAPPHRWGGGEPNVAQGIPEALWLLPKSLLPTCCLKSPWGHNPHFDDPCPSIFITWCFIYCCPVHISTGLRCNRVRKGNRGALHSSPILVLLLISRRRRRGGSLEQKMVMTTNTAMERIRCDEQ